MAPTTGKTTTRKAFSGQLRVAGSHGTVTYAQSVGSPDLTVSASGRVSAPATLAAGSYKATGRVKDSSGDAGTWGFSLTVSATKISQVGPTSAATTVGENFTGRLRGSGSHGTLTYTRWTRHVRLKVSSAGKIYDGDLGRGHLQGHRSDQGHLRRHGRLEVRVDSHRQGDRPDRPDRGNARLGKASRADSRAPAPMGRSPTHNRRELLAPPSRAPVRCRAEATLPAGTYKAAGTTETHSVIPEPGSLRPEHHGHKAHSDRPDRGDDPAGKAFTGR